MAEETKKGLNPGATEFSGDKKSTGLRPEAAPFVKNEGEDAAGSALRAEAEPWKPRQGKRGPRGGRKGKGQKGGHVDPQMNAALMQQQQMNFMQMYGAVRQQYLQAILQSSGVNAMPGGAPPPQFTLPDGTVLSQAPQGASQKPLPKPYNVVSKPVESVVAEAPTSPAPDLLRSATVMQRKAK